MKTIMLTAFAAAILAAPAFSQGAGGVTKAQAEKTALERVKGAVVKSAELEKEEGKEVWSFDLKAGGKIREIWVDAKTGTIIKDKEESAAAEKTEAAKDKAARKPHKAAPGARITKAQAEKTALGLAKGASVKEGELERENGKLVWSFDLDDAGRTREIQVNALTGAIVSDKIESPADETKEKAADAAGK